MIKWISAHPILSVLIVVAIVGVVGYITRSNSPVTQNSSADKQEGDVSFVVPMPHGTLLSPDAVEVRPFVQNSSTNYNKVYKNARYVNGVFMR